MDRPRLTQLLGLATTKKLTVVVAPAGYGKTVLLSSWARSAVDRSVAWVTIEPGDDATLIASKLCASLSRADETGLDDLLESVSLDANRLGERFIDGLLKSIGSSLPITLILDDLHELKSRVVLGELEELIELAPPQLRFIVSSRLDPALRCHRLRLIDEVRELRSADLRFDATETTELVQRLSGRHLSDIQLGTLADRTEGWAMGLRLASLALRGRNDADRFVSTFAGDERHVAEFLTQQVLSQMQPELREFLLEVSVLDRLSGPLCGAVTGRSEAIALLDRLTAESLFVTAVDHRREWFVCHQMLRDLLLSHLRASDPAAEAKLRLRAASWYLDHDDIETAGNYVASSGDDKQIIHAVRMHGRDLHRTGRLSTTIRWLDALSPEFRARPEVAIPEANCRMLAGEPDEASRILEALVMSEALDDMDRLLVDYIASYSVQFQPATGSVLESTRRALAGLDALTDPTLPDPIGFSTPAAIRKGCLVNRAMATLFDGDNEQARSILLAASGLPHGSTPLEIDEAGLLSIVEAWDGELNSAEQLARRALAIAEAADMGGYPGTSSALLALGHVSRQRGQAARARTLLAAAESQLVPLGPNLFSTVIAAERSLVEMSEGDPEFGLAIVAAHRQTAVVTSPTWVAGQLDRAEARLFVSVGELDQAQRLADGLHGYGSEVMDLRMLLAVEREDLTLAGQLLESWPKEQSHRCRVQQLVWQWILSDNLDDGATLDRLLRQIGDQGDVQLLLDSGHRGRRLLRARQNLAPTPLLERLVELPAPPTRSGAPRVPELIERLTDREMAVLRFLPTRLDNTEIATALGMSVNTLKTHLKHIFRKLDVRNRRASIDTAERLGLL
ncbi:MAG TPA: LuxR C-terminal-related transcriptional regulator [Microthrixaceae bacterium]|nr:LuxR C-terminal-related transcriptional regulator [Microthrixaceae bacterium]